MNTQLILSKKQVLQLHEMLIVDYPDEDKITLDISYSSGIGLNVNAMVRYLGCREDCRDITDYDIW